MVDGTLTHRYMNEEINLLATTDASVWASEFLKVIKKEGIQLLLDEDCLRSWFANAIMCGYDHSNSDKDNQYIYILKSHSGEIVKIYNYEPTSSEMDKDYAAYLKETFTADLVGFASWNCALYRWRKIDTYLKDQSIQVWNGRAETAYNWKEI
jgi:hypothetical protein